MSNFNAIPLSYTTPEFPSLYWPFHTDPNEPKYLYTLRDIWKFTFYWTLITIPLAHIVVALWAIFMQFLSARDRSRYLALHSRRGKRGDPKRNNHTRSGAVSNTEDEDEDEDSNDHDSSDDVPSPMSEKSAHGMRRQPKRQRKLTAKNRKLLGSSPFKSTVKYAGLILGVYVVLGAIEALIAGSLVGLVLGAVYNAGYFRMSVWTPLFWGIINMLVLILASFRISGGM